MATVLVVEDDRAIRGLCVEVFEGLGYDVAQAADGAAAIVEIDRSRPSAVVLDWRLPHMRGADVLEYVRVTDGRTATPVVVISATGARAASMREGASAYLAKPFDLGELVNVVEDSLVGSPR